MKKSHIYLLLASLFVSFSASAQVKDTMRGETGVGEWPFSLSDDGSRGVYDEDDRLDVTDAEGYDDFVRATAVMVLKENVRGNKVYGWSLRESLTNQFGTDKFDPKVKFLDQITAGSCTGFLIAPDILVTAGHCIEAMKECKDFVWLFDYTNDIYHNDAGNYITVDYDDIYNCKEIITTKLGDGDDYCFIRLDRKTNRDPYRFRTSGKIADYEDIFMIGSSTGLPLKLSTNGYVRYNSWNQYFTSNLESFPGNSGGPVFDAAGFIEGIHVRGSVDEVSRTGDYKYDKSCDCITLVQWDWPYGGYRGASAHRITEVPFEVLLTSIYENVEYAIKEKNQARLAKWLIYKGIVEHEYTVERGRFEFMAAEGNNLEALKAVMEDSEDKNIVDENGRSLLYYAIKNGNSDMVKFLLEQGVSPTKEDSYGSNPVFWAVSYGQSNILKQLLDRGASANGKDSYGDTPLHIAARRGDISSAGYLIAKGANLDAVNSRGWTPKKLAKKSKQKPMKKYLKKAAKGR
ncbi:trypsin-like serine protease [bacterium]|nr:trypsin-like serine protease [bacterium]